MSFLQFRGDASRRYYQETRVSSITPMFLLMQESAVTPHIVGFDVAATTFAQVIWEIVVDGEEAPLHLDGPTFTFATKVTELTKSAKWKKLDEDVKANLTKGITGYIQLQKAVSGLIMISEGISVEDCAQRLATRTENIMNMLTQKGFIRKSRFHLEDEEGGAAPMEPMELGEFSQLLASRNLTLTEDDLDTLLVPPIAAAWTAEGSSGAGKLSVFDDDDANTVFDSLMEDTTAEPDEEMDPDLVGIGESVKVEG